jgi:hypothetical protein
MQGKTSLKRQPLSVSMSRSKAGEGGVRACESRREQVVVVEGKSRQSRQQAQQEWQELLAARRSHHQVQVATAKVKQSLGADKVNLQWWSNSRTANR